MLKEHDVVLRRLMIALDILVISAALFISYFLRTHIHSIYQFDIFPSRSIIGENADHFSEYALFLILAAPVWCFFLFRNGIYNSWRLRTVRSILKIIWKSSAIAFLVLGMALFVFKLTFMSRLVFVTFAFLGFVFLMSEKLGIFVIMHAVRRRGYNYRRVLGIGTGRRAEIFIKRIQNHPEWGLKVIGAIEDESGRGIETVDGVSVIGELKDLGPILHREVVDEVVIVVPRLRLQYVENAVRECEIEGVKTTVAVDLFDLRIAKAYPAELANIPLLTYRTTVPSEWELFVKRTIDIVVSGLLLICLSPALAVIAIVIKVTSRGPMFFKQERIGLNKRHFTMYKFRTMVEGAQKNLAKVDIYHEIYESGWKEKKLSCTTPFGKLLRKFSLDELPQLINVFLGHMSLVGPRPTLPGEVEQYESWHRRRFSMRPGLTCLWQVNGRRDVKFEEWMKMDLEYLDKWSLWLDIKILLKTIPAVFFGTGAY